MGNDSGERGGVGGWGDPESVNKQWLPERVAKGQHPELVWWPGLASEEGCALLCNRGKGAEVECGGWKVCGLCRRGESPWEFLISL